MHPEDTRLVPAGLGVRRGSAHHLTPVGSQTLDVLLTRQQERTNGMNDVVIQNARVLAVDQLADDAADRPTVVKAVTVEVDLNVLAERGFEKAYPEDSEADRDSADDRRWPR